MRYFAYGSNLDQEDLKKWCKMKKLNTLKLKNPQCHCLKDYKLGFTRCSESRKCGVADIINSPGDFCWGVIFDISDDDWKVLNKKEGCKLDQKNSAYKRCHLFDDVYTYEVVKKKKFVRPSTDYVDLIINGAKHYGLPESWINKLESFKEKTYDCTG